MQRGKKKTNNDILLDNKQLPGEGSGPCLLRRAVGEEEGGVQGMVAPKGRLALCGQGLKSNRKGSHFFAMRSMAGWPGWANQKTQLGKGFLAQVRMVQYVRSAWAGGRWAGLSSYLRGKSFQRSKPSRSASPASTGHAVWAGDAGGGGCWMVPSDYFRVVWLWINQLL